MLPSNVHLQAEAAKAAELKGPHSFSLVALPQHLHPQITCLQTKELLLFAL
jgi:hypothetical protein